jgi:hypothetical protein|tara:strand:+ start:1139 stop:1495 length:357 start_codon:yes stop_codon:yes gene_type:complete
MTKISKPTTSATVTPTVDAASVARCGIPAPTANGRGNIKLSLAGDAAAKMAALEKPLPAQAQAILYQLDQLGGVATQAELIKALDDKDSVLQTVQGATRIVTFYRKRLLKEKLITAGS